MSSLTFPILSHNSKLNLIVDMANYTYCEPLRKDEQFGVKYRSILILSTKGNLGDF